MASEKLLRELIRRIWMLELEMEEYQRERENEANAAVIRLMAWRALRDARFELESSRAAVTEIRQVQESAARAEKAQKRRRQP